MIWGNGTNAGKWQNSVCSAEMNFACLKKGLFFSKNFFSVLEDKNGQIGKCPVNNYYSNSGKVNFRILYSL